MIRKIGVILWLLANLGLRIYGTDKSPPSINFDEAALGYNAYSLMLTGKDEYGISWPLSLRSFNDYKPALYSILTIIPVNLFGLNDFSTRFVSGFFGTLSLWWLYLILRKFVSDKSWRFWLILAVVGLLPWRLHYSRVAFESNLSMSWWMMGVWGLLYFKKSIWTKLAAIIGFCLSIYSYHSARLAVPLIILLTAVDPLKNWIRLGRIKFWKKTTKVLWILPIILILVGPIFLDKRANLVLARFNQTNIFQKYFPYAPGELLTADNVWTDWRANPVYYLLGLLTGHVTAYLSPVNWGKHIYHWILHSPQAIAGGGMLGLAEAMAMIVGLGIIFNSFRRRKYRFLVYWGVAGISAAALTLDWFHPLRSLNSFAVIEIAAVLGLWKLLNFKWGKWPVVVLLIMEAVFNYGNEVGYGMIETHGEYQPGGFKEGATILKENWDKYDTIYIDSPHAQSYIFFLYYLGLPPKMIQQYAAVRPAVGTDGNLNFDFGKIVFKKYNWPNDKEKSSFIYFTSSEVIDEEINGTAGARLYRIVNGLGQHQATIITKE